MSGPSIRKLYYSTAEVSEIAQVKPYVLNNWEALFPLFKPTVRGNRRLFTPGELELVLKIKELKDKGCSNEAIREELSRQKKHESKELTDLKPGEFVQDSVKMDSGIAAHIIRELEDILKMLSR